jgi:nitroreductase
MRAHSSVRAFKPEALDPSRIRAAVSAAQMAATSSHVQSYALLQLTDRTVRARIAELSGNQAYVADCGAFFVVCGDMRRHRLIADRAGKRRTDNLETFLLAVIDASLFAQNLVLAFESDGLGICYIGGLRNELPTVDSVLGLPEGVLPFYGLCVGEPIDKPAVKPRLPVEAVWFRDHYPSDDEMLALVDAYDETMAAYYAGRGLAGRNWSGAIWRRFEAETRGHLAAYYGAKGAKLS